MRASQAIETADRLRPNTIDRLEKWLWLWELEVEIAEMMGVDAPVWDEDDDPELLLDDPKSNVYPLYLLPRIDHAQEETDLYMIDSAQANAVLTDIKNWYRRTHASSSTANMIKGVWI